MTALSNCQIFVHKKSSKLRFSSNSRRSMTQVQRGVRYAHSYIRVGSISFCLVTPSLFWYTIGHESKCQNYGFKLRKLFRQINIGRSLLCLTMTVAKLSQVTKGVLDKADGLGHHMMKLCLNCCEKLI